MVKFDNKTILTDVDGVLLNWEYAFGVWMQHNGYVKKEDSKKLYSLSECYGISSEESKRLVLEFNHSAAIGFLPPLRDAIHYVELLKQDGYKFHVISSLSTDKQAGMLRTMNLEKLFGEDVFDRFVYLNTGDEKNEALEVYRDSGLIWIEDKIENLELGISLGLRGLLMAHGHNFEHVTQGTIVKNWQEIYEYIKEKG